MKQRRTQGVTAWVRRSFIFSSLVTNLTHTPVGTLAKPGADYQCSPVRILLPMDGDAACGCDRGRGLRAQP